MSREPVYLLRLVDRGPVKGVPVTDVYLIRVDGVGSRTESCAMHATGRNPADADHLAESFAALGIVVERVRQSIEPGAVNGPAAAAEKRRGGM